MEEICHVFLGHSPNRLAIVAASKGGRAVARDYKKSDEEAAYGIGAAALWFHYGTAVFFEMIAAGISACF